MSGASWFVITFLGMAFLCGIMDVVMSCQNDSGNSAATNTYETWAGIAWAGTAILGVCFGAFVGFQVGHFWSIRAGLCFSAVPLVLLSLLCAFCTTRKVYEQERRGYTGKPFGWKRKDK